MSKRRAQRPQRQETVAALEAELVRLTTLVRERRDQLAKLENCPNPSCPCRQLWRRHVDKNLACQMGKIRRHVRGKRRRARA